MKDLTGKYEFEFEEGVVVDFSRVPGTKGYDCAVDCTGSTAAIRALAIITEGVAKRLEVPVENVLCKLATVLVVPDSQAVGEEDSGASRMPRPTGERIATSPAAPRNDVGKEEG